MRFKEYSFKSLLKVIIDNRGKTCPTDDTGIPLIATNCIKNDALYPVHEKVRYVDQETYQNWFRGHPAPGDMIFVCKGSPGRVCWVPDPVDFCIAQDMVAIRADDTKVYPKYLFALLRSEETQQKILNMHVGTLIPHFKKGDFGNLYFNIPEDMGYQKIVGDAYFKFCEKIHLNTQTNQTLESIAQAIFKSWFVDFDPVKAKIAAKERWYAMQPTSESASPVCYADDAALPDLETYTNLAAMCAISGKNETELAHLQQQNTGQHQQLAETAALFPSAMVDSDLGEIPEGWEVKKIKESASVIKGKSYKSTELQESKTALVTLKSFNRGGGYRLDGLKGYVGTYKKEQEVFAGDLVIAYTDVTQAADVIGKPALVISDPQYDHLAISLDVAVIRPTEDIHKFFFYGLANTETFQQHTHAHSTGTTVLHLSANAIPDFEYAHPNGNLLKKYSEITQSIFQKKDSLVGENRSFESLRDSLLPKLLSGEIDLSETESALTLALSQR